MSVLAELNSAIKSSLLSKYFLYVFQILSLALLSRIFVPEDFGKLAVLQVCVLFFQLVVTSGLSSSIIFQQTFSHSQRDGVFSFTMIFGFFVSFIVFFVSPIFIKFLGIIDSDYFSYILCLSLFFSSLSMVPLSALQKDVLFVKIAKCDIFSEIISLVILLYLFTLDFTILALSSRLVVIPLFRFVFYYYYSLNTSLGRPFLGKEIKSFFILLPFIKFQFAFNFLNFFSRNIDTVLISKFFGFTVLGFYEKSYQLMRYPLQLFTFAITPALQPVLTKYKHDPKVVELHFYDVCFKLSLLGLVVSSIFYWCSFEVVFIFFGPQWDSAATVLNIFSITIPLQMVLSSTGGIYQSFGATREMFYCGVFSSVTTVSAISLGIYSHDLYLMCYLISASYLFNFLQCFYLLHLRVFKTTNKKKFLLLATIVVIPYFFFLLPSGNVSNLDYASSIINIFVFIFPIIFIVIMGYFNRIYLSKIYRKFNL